MLARSLSIDWTGSRHGAGNKAVVVDVTRDGRG
jgi:hypothetical protein